MGEKKDVLGMLNHLLSNEVEAVKRYSALLKKSKDPRLIEFIETEERHISLLKEMIYSVHRVAPPSTELNA